MCLDPHAVAKIEVRAALELLEARLEEIKASNVEVSGVVLTRIARLKRLLHSCDSCFSRRRSELLLMLIVRALAEIVFRLIETSNCSQLAALSLHRRIDDCRTSDSSPPPFLRLIPSGTGVENGHLCVLSLAHRGGQAGAEYRSPAQIERRAWRTRRIALRHSTRWIKRSSGRF